ncbi:MAG: T9SS C-terminal target domain-containing protein [Candidatus Kapaibacterium sp.]|nr:MAG: T9SS C-terminal target domain-containing protein [Candidatus Kapabacteria bacterium]
MVGYCSYLAGIEIFRNNRKPKSTINTRFDAYIFYFVIFYFVIFYFVIFYFVIFYFVIFYFVICFSSAFHHHHRFLKIPMRSLSRNTAWQRAFQLFLLIIIFYPQAHFAQTDPFRGPLARITSGFGADGAFQVDTLRFPASGWEGAPNQTVQNVQVFIPRGNTAPRPTLLFAHGFGGFDVRFYGELLQHVASRGYVAVFVPYPVTINFPALYRTMDSGFAEAVRRFPQHIDSTRIGFMGHSFGAGAIPSIAFNAYTQRGWGRNGKFLFPMAPFYALETTPEMTRRFPSDTKLLMQIYRDDRTNDHALAIDIFRTINISPAEKDFITVVADTVAGYVFNAGHGLCNTANNPANGSAFDGYDVYAVFRPLDALMEYTFNPSNSAAKNVALGNGSAEQVFMGMVGNRALKPLRVSDAPLPDPEAPRAQFLCNNEVNIRREFCTFTMSNVAWNQGSQAVSSSQMQMLGIAPQPASEQVTLSFSALSSGTAHVSVYNSMGQEVMRVSEELRSTTGRQELHLSTHNLPSGVYGCRVQQGALFVSGVVVIHR